MKDVTKFKNNHGIIFQGRCPKIGSNNHYLGETGCRILQGELDHAENDQNSRLFKLPKKSGHPVLDMNNYKIFKKGYRNNVRKRKVVEALLIKEVKPTLNNEDNSVEIKLFN